MILERHLFDIAAILHSLVIQCMTQPHECIQDPKMAKPVLVRPSFIIKICFNNGIDLSPIGTITHHMMPFTDTTVRRSMNAR